MAPALVQLALIVRDDDEAIAWYTAALGKQAGGRVFPFPHSDDFERDHARLAAHGARSRAHRP